MIKEIKTIWIYSELNPWIDFCIIPHDPKDFNTILNVSQKSYDEWFKIDPEETIIDYIKRNLETENLEFDIYINSDDEDEIF